MCWARPAHTVVVAHLSADMRGARSRQAMRDLPPDVIRMLVRAALAAEGDSLAAWLRLSMVSRAWRESLTGILWPLVADVALLTAPLGMLSPLTFTAITL